MEVRIGRAVSKATSSLRVRYISSCRSSAVLQFPTAPRCLHTSSARDATPLPHPTVPGPPPGAPQAAVSNPQDRVARKRQQAELLKQSQQKKINPSKPSSALQKRFWKEVSVKETEHGLQVMLDTRPVRTASKQILTLPHGKGALAASIALEWDQLVSAQQALKHHYIPMTSMTSRAVDIVNAEKEGDRLIREDLITMVMRYLGTDTLLCWAPEKDLYNPVQPDKKPLRQRQKEVAEPIIAYLCAHVFPGVEIHPILDPDSIVPRKQPEVTRDVIRGWLAGLPAFELAALERGVLATKSLLVAIRLLVEWSPEFAHLRQGQSAAGASMFGVDEAAEAATLEVMYQTEQWGEVEDTHDVDREDLRRQLGSVVILVS